MWAGGRTALLAVDEAPIDGHVGGCVLKLKGIGHENGRIPGRRPYRVAPRLACDVVPAIDVDGAICFRPEDAEPDGGLRLDGALREFEAAGILQCRGVPSIKPVAVVAYEGRDFIDYEGRAHPLGVAVTLLPDGRTTRLSHVLSNFNLGSDRSTSNVPFALDLTRWYALAGQLLRSFHAAGLVRHGTCLDNIGCDLTAPFLVDLDTATPIAQLDEPALEMTRDVCEGLFSASIELVRPARAHHPMTVGLVNRVMAEFLRAYMQRRLHVRTMDLARYVADVRERVAALQGQILDGGLAGRKLFHENRLQVDELEPLFVELARELRPMVQNILGHWRSD